MHRSISGPPTALGALKGIAPFQLKLSRRKNVYGPRTPPGHEARPPPFQLKLRRKIDGPTLEADEARPPLRPSGHSHCSISAQVESAKNVYGPRRFQNLRRDEARPPPFQLKLSRRKMATGLQSKVPPIAQTRGALTCIVPFQLKLSLRKNVYGPALEADEARLGIVQFLLKLSRRKHVYGASEGSTTSARPARLHFSSS
jgi:hypothetical protein